MTLPVNSEIVNDVTVISLDKFQMSIGERIEERLEAIGISQSELARRVGVRQSTMNSLIRGENRTSRKIVAIARELRTTPAYLSGEVDDPAGVSEPTGMGAEEQELFDHFGHLAPADRRALLQIARSMAGGASPSDTVHGRGGIADVATVHDREQHYRGHDQ